MRLTIFLSRFILTAGATLTLAACSLYESSGRKSLENSAYDIANGTASLVGCQQSVDPAGSLLRDDDQASIFSHQDQVRVTLKNNSTFSCDFEVMSTEAIRPYLDELVAFTTSQQKNH
jgi:hypothetical protein